VKPALFALCWRIALACGACAILGCGCSGHRGTIREIRVTREPADMVEALNALRNDKLLDQRSYGLDRTYPECPNYSDRFTQQAIEKRLDALLNHRRPE